MSRLGLIYSSAAVREDVDGLTLGAEIARVSTVNYNSKPYLFVKIMLKEFQEKVEVALITRACPM